MKTTNRPELSFDGFGINGPDEYRRRLCKFNHMDYSEADCQRYGKLFAAAPELLEELKETERDLNCLLEWLGVNAPNESIRTLMGLRRSNVAKAIAKAEGKAVQVGEVSQCL